MPEKEFYDMLNKLNQLMVDTGLSRRAMCSVIHVSNTSVSRWFSDDPEQHRRATANLGRNVAQKVNKLNAAHAATGLFHVIQPLAPDEKVAALQDVLFDRVTQ